MKYPPTSSGPEAIFQSWVDEKVEDKAGSAGGDFGHLVGALPAIYPGEVLASVRRLTVARRIKGAALEASSKQPASGSREAREPFRDVLPVPHPLDYDWRFGSQALNLLGEEIRRASPADGVMLLGTPSLYLSLKRSGNLRATLLEGSSTVAAALRGQDGDAQVREHTAGRDPINTFEAGVTVIDPPWYEEYFRVFLAEAARVTRVGGTVLVAFPPRGTRPGIEEERARTIAFAQTVGLQWKETVSTCLPYVSPPFEQAALLASDIVNFPRDWRKGDLLKFKKRETELDGPRQFSPPSQQWVEHEVGGVRIKTRDRVANGNGPLIQPLVPGNVLPSVSRRHPIRRSVDLWTCCNRVMACDDVPRVRRLLDWMTGGASAMGLGPERSALAQLTELVEVESREILAYR